MDANIIGLIIYIAGAFVLTQKTSPTAMLAITFMIVGNNIFAG